MSVINFDKILGNHERAFMIQSRRSSVLASNIVNSDTPGYKAQDIDFRSVLKKSQGDLMTMQTTRPGHIQSAGSQPMGIDLKYRVPTQPSLDGNTVDLNAEKAAYAENAVRYQASLRFLTGKFKGIKNALKEE